MLSFLRAIFAILLICRGLGAQAGVHVAKPKLAVKQQAATILQIKTILKKYQNADAVKLAVKKKVLLALLEEEKNSEGQLVLSKGRLKLQIQSPDPSLVVVNKEVIWVETPAPAEMNAKTQVLKIKSQDFNRQSKAPLAMLMGKSKVWDQFKVVERQQEGAAIRVSLAPKAQEALGEITKITLVLNPEQQTLKSLGYQDEIGNETKFEFLSEDFKAKVAETEWQYTPPKNSEVTEY